MKRILTNNLLLKIAAVIIAMLLWASIQISEDAVIEKSYNIPVNYTNAEYLEQNNLYLKEYPKTVTITVRAKTSAFKNIRSDKFTATADLSKRYGDDPYNKSVGVNIAVDSTIDSSVIELTCKSGNYLDLILGDIQEKTFQIQVMTKGELPEGLHLSEDGFTVMPEQVTVRGPETVFSKLNQVAAIVDLDGFDGDVLTVQAALALYDNDDKIIETDENTRLSVDMVQITTDVLKTKKVSVSFEGISGTPAEGYRYSELSSDLEEVEVVGLKTDLAELTNIIIPKEVLNISNAKENVELHIDISQYLPENIVLYGSQTVANVTLYIEQLQEKGYRIRSQNIQIEGMSEAYEYEILNSSVLVTLEGFQEDLESLNAEELGVFVNVEGYEPGVYDGVTVIVKLRDGFRLVNSPKIQIRVRKPEETVEESSSEETETIPETEESVIETAEDITDEKVQEK